MMAGSRRDIDGEIVYDTTDPARPEYDPSTSSPPATDRIAALEAKLEAVEALATKADATAQEVARAARDATTERSR